MRKISAFLAKHFCIFRLCFLLFILHTSYFILPLKVEGGIFVVSGSSRTFRSTGTVSAIWTEMTSLPAPGAATYQDICRDALGHLYVLRSDGYVFRSRDGGRSWTQQNTLPPATATNYDSIIADTGTAGVLYVMRVTGEVYRSTDEGLNWPNSISSPNTKETHVGIGIGRTSLTDPSPRLFLIDDDGTTYYTSLDLSLAWGNPAQTDVGGATDYTDLHGGYKGYLYVLDNDGPVVKSDDGATSAWVALTNNPPAAANFYARIEQDWDILSSSPSNLYALQTGGLGARSVDGGATAWTSWTDIGPLSNYYGLGSCDLVFPGIVNNVTEIVKATWRNTDPGAIYDVDFQDTDFGTVFCASYTICSLSGQNGTQLKNWTYVSEMKTNVSLSTAEWRIDFSACQEATTNFVSVRVLDNGGNEAVVNDVFYVLKDTTSPTAVTLELPPDTTTLAYPNIFFNWTDASDTRSGVENYLLQISTASNFSIINYSSSPAISQATITITVDNLHYWRVRAKDKAGNYSVTWTTRSFTVNASPPSIPQNFVATAGGERVDLSWNANAEADMWRYEIQRSTFSASAGFSTLTYILHPGTTHQDKGLVSDNTYYYKIQAIDTANNPSGFTSSVSAIPYDTIPPSAVTNLVALPGTNEGEVKLSWPMPGDDGMSGTIMNGQIKIQTSTVAGVTWSTANAQIMISTSAVTPGTTVSLNITNLTPSVTYYFRLWTADERFNWSAISNGATTWAQDLIPSVPNNFQATAGGELVNLSWTANIEADIWRYEIQSSTYSSTLGWSLLTYILHPGTTHQDSGLVSDNTYYYKMWAIDMSGKQSVFTSTVSAIPYDTIPPAAVTNLDAISGPNEREIKLSWSVPGDDGMSGTIMNGTIKIQTSTVVGVVWSTANAQVTISTSGVIPGTTVSTVIGSLTEGGTYYFRLWTADEKSNWSGISNGATTWAKREAPAPVSNFSAVASTHGARIDLSWTASTSTDRAGTRICWSASTYPVTPEEVDISSRTDILYPTASYVHLELTANVTYYYSAFAYDNAITPNYSLSMTTSAFPTAPGDVIPPGVSTITATTGVNEGEIILTWSAPGDDGFTDPITNGYYEIKYSSVSAQGWADAPYTLSWSTSNVNLGDSQAKTISNLYPGNTYYFWLRTGDEVPNWSGLSNKATSWAQDLVPSSPTAFSVSDPGLDEKLNLSWNANSEIDIYAYKIYHSTFSSSLGSKSSVTTILHPGTTHQDTGLTNNLTYYYQVTALDFSLKESAGSVEISTFPTDKVVPNAVTNLTATTGSQEKTILLNWNFTGDNGNTGGLTTGYYRVQWATYSAYGWDINTAVEYSTNNVSQGAFAYHTVTGTISGLPLLEGGTYHFRLWLADEARNWSGISNSTYSWAKRQAPENVSNFTIFALPEGNKINLSWSTATITAPDFQGVRICSSTVWYPGPNDYNVGIVTDVAKTTTFYFHLGLVDNVTCYYRAWAYDEVRNYAVEIATTSTYPRDVIPPARVLDLSTGTVTGTSVELRWTAPGDNENSPGSFTGEYWIKGTTYTTITDTNWGIIVSTLNITWSTTTIQGNLESRTITGLRTDTTYYFALRTRDEVPNQWSYVSNCATGTTRDTTAPAKVTNLTTVSGGIAGTVRLKWSAPGDDDGMNGTLEGEYWIQNSTWTGVFWSTASVQVIISTSGVSPGTTVSTVIGDLTPATTYYFHLWSADEVYNWSELSNRATGYATAIPPTAVKIFLTTTTLTSPFTLSTSTNSCKLSISTPVTADYTTKIQPPAIDYFQFRPRQLNTASGLPSTLTQHGWLWQTDWTTLKTLFSGSWEFKMGWKNDVAGDKGYFNYRISKVSATVSGGIVLREDLSGGWKGTAKLSSSTVAGTVYYTQFYTETISSTTFEPGEYLFLELGIQDTVDVKTVTDLWYLEINISSNYVVTPDIRDITPPAEISDLYAVASTTKGYVNLSWTAVGNNGLLGRATYYDIRYVTDPGFGWTANWSLATVWKEKRYSTVSYPGQEYETASGLTPGVTYYFRMRAYDDATPLPNWSLSNQAVAWVYVATHTVNLSNTVPVHRRMNDDKKDDLLKITISNGRGLGYGAVYLSSVTVRFTRDGSNALDTNQAKSLFNNIYLYADEMLDGFYHYVQDLSTVAIISNANIFLSDGEQIIPTLNVSARLVNPQDIKNYFLVVGLKPDASSQTVNSFSAGVQTLAKIKIIDANTNTEDTTIGTVTSFPVISSTVTAISPVTRRSGTNWPFNLGAKVQSVPLVYWDRVYIGADNGNFYCLDSSGTNLLWSEPFTTDGNSAVCTAPFPDWKFYNPETDTGPHYIYFTDISGTVYKIEDQGTGWFPVWQRTGVKASTGSWLGYDYGVDNIYFGATNAKVYKIGYSGSDTSPFPITVGASAFNSTPAVDTRPDPGINSLWIGNEAGELYRISTSETGEILQSISPGGSLNASPNLVAGYSVDVGGTGNNLYFASTNGKLYCCTASNLTSIPSGWKNRVGQVDGEFDAGGSIYSGPYFTPYEAGAYLYFAADFGTDKGKVYKLNAQNGTKVWEYQTDGKIRSQIVYVPQQVEGKTIASDDYVYFGSDDGYIYCLKASDGSLRPGWPVQTGASIRSSPVIDTENNTLTIGSDDGNVYQLKIGD